MGKKLTDANLCGTVGSGLIIESDSQSKLSIMFNHDSNGSNRMINDMRSSSIDSIDRITDHRSNSQSDARCESSLRIRHAASLV